MRVLVMGTPSPTHFTPLVPLAWALRAAGHEVLVAGPPDLSGAIAAAGLNHVPVGDAFDGTRMLLSGLRDGQRPLEARPREAFRIGGYARVWAEQARRTVRDHLGFARGFRPDLLVADPLEFGALIVGAVLGVPVVHHRWGVDPMSGPARREARSLLADLCREFGLDGGLPDPDVVLDPCPPSLQLPGTAPGTPVRHVPSTGNGTLPAWLRRSAAPGGGIRRVAVSLGGTPALNGVPFTRRLLRVLGSVADTEVIATVEARHREEIGPLPGGVRMVDPLPLHLLLGGCDAVVHHGGCGTSMTATAFGLPQLVLPQLADHFAQGDRLAAAGAAVALDTAREQDDPARLREAFTELLSAPRYGRAAGRLAREMRLMPSPARVADDLVRDLAGSRPASAARSARRSARRGENACVSPD